MNRDRSNEPNSDLLDVFERVTDEWNQGNFAAAESLISKYPEYADRLRNVVPMLGLIRDSSEPDTSVHQLSGIDGTLGDFQLIREIGRGGMGLVYEAWQISLKRRVAVKVLPFAALLHESQLQRFKIEAQAAASLHHPHIVNAFFVGQERGVHFYAMRLIEGRSIAEMIEELRSNARPTESALERFKQPIKRCDSDRRIPAPLSRDETRPKSYLTTERSDNRTAYFQSIARLGKQAAEALAYAHQMGVVHRDVKPSNLLLDKEGHLWLADFGLASTHADVSMTLTGDLLGTLRYMSPEQAAGDTNSSGLVDIYSLGVTIYELMTLRPALLGVTRADLLKSLESREPVRPRAIDPTIPRDLEKIVLRAASRVPSDRYQSAADLAKDFQRFLDHQPVHARRISTIDRMWRWVRRKPGQAAASLLILVLLFTIASGGVFTSMRLRTQAERRRHDLYVSVVHSAYNAWQDGNLVRASELLNRLKPQPDEQDLRGFQWHHLRLELDRLLSMPKLEHEAPVNAVAFSPDGRVMATGDSQGQLRLWDFHLGHQKLLATFGDTSDPVTDVAFSPDGSKLAVSCLESPATIWDVSKRHPTRVATVGPDRSVAVEFSADGRSFVSAGKPDMIEVCRTDTWTPSVRFTHPRVTAVAISPTGPILASVGEDCQVRLWDRATGRELDSSFSHDHPIYAVAFSPDGRSVATGGFNYETRVWDLPSRRPVRTFRSPGHSVASLAFSADGRFLATAGPNRTGHLWDVVTGDRAATFKGHTSDLTMLAFSPEGHTIATASADGTVRFWDHHQRHAKRPKIAGGHVFSHLAFSPDGNQLASATAPTGGLRTATGKLQFWNLETGQGRERGNDRTAYWFVSFSSPSKVIAAVNSKTNTLLKRLDSNTGKILYSTPSEEFYRGDYSASINAVAIGETTGRVVLRNADDLCLRYELKKAVDKQTIMDVVFSFDGSLVAAAVSRRRGNLDWDESVIHVWDTRTGNRVSDLQSRQKGICALAFSPDGSTLASGGFDDEITLWNVSDWSEQTRLRGHTMWVLALAFSPNGLTLASGSADTTIRLWNLVAKQEIAVLRQHTGVASLAFSPDGTVLAAGHIDGEIEVLHSRPEQRSWPRRLGPASKTDRATDG